MPRGVALIALALCGASALAQPAKVSEPPAAPAVKAPAGEPAADAKTPTADDKAAAAQPDAVAAPPLFDPRAPGDLPTNGELEQATPPDAIDTEMGLGWTLLRTLVVLGIVVALAWLTLNVGLRKLLGIRPVSRGAPLVTVLERVPLDQKRSLFVVRAANEVLLLGGGDAGLSLLSKLDAAEVERLRPATPANSPVQMSPLLMKLLGRKDAAPPAKAAPEGGEDQS